MAFLASEDASYYVGATLSPNGGLVTAVYRRSPPPAMLHCAPPSTVRIVPVV